MFNAFGYVVYVANFAALSVFWRVIFSVFDDFTVFYQ